MEVAFIAGKLVAQLLLWSMFVVLVIMADTFWALLPAFVIYFSTIVIMVITKTLKD